MRYGSSMSSTRWSPSSNQRKAFWSGSKPRKKGGASAPPGDGHEPTVCLGENAGRNHTNGRRISDDNSCCQQWTIRVGIRICARLVAGKPELSARPPIPSAEDGERSLQRRALQPTIEYLRRCPAG